MLCDDSLKEQIRHNLGALDVRRADPGTHRIAAVAVAVAEEGEGAHLEGLADPAGWSREAALILTRRASDLRDHPGQWALPGGRVDAGESAEETALRELAEEVGLVLDAGAVLGRLDDYITRSGFAITPVVVWAGTARTLAANPAEVASIHRIPVNEFMRTDAPWLDPIADSEHPVLRMPVGLTWIAAPTAAVLYQFRELCIAGRPTRVGHFEQPLFARR
jgi:8-oxo-dGTP pyrophosphatase MutT (NUDIX family)